MGYGTMQGWIAYASAGGDVVDDSTLAQQALVRAQRYIENFYVRRFIRGDENSDGVENAVYEAARLELATPNFFNTTFTPSQQKVLTGVDSIRWTPVTPNTRDRAATQAAPVSTLIDAMLGPYMPPETGVFPYMRAVG